MLSGLTYVQVMRVVSSLAPSSSPPNSSIPGQIHRPFIDVVLGVAVGLECRGQPLRDLVAWRAVFFLQVIFEMY